VILAKDGVHTIEYQKLVDAREAEKAAKAEAEALKAELETLKNAAPPPAPTPAPTSAPAPAADKPDFGDFSDEAIAAGIEKSVAQRVAAAREEMKAEVAQMLAPIQQKAVEAATTDHFTTIYKAHPNMDAMLESKELESWITSQPAFAQAGIRHALDKGTASQVVEVFDSFVKATGKTAAPPPPGAPAAPAVDPKAAAKAAIDAAAAKAPSSLSDIPGSMANHDEAAAMLEMSPTALLRKFEGKTPEQIEALMAKAL
jgi:hypothetical protein